MRHRASRPGVHFKVVYLVIAVICIMIGIVGLIIPIIPGVLFLVAAVYFLSKVSNRVRRWSERQPILNKLQNKLQRLNTVDMVDRVKVVALMSLEMLVSTVEQGIRMARRVVRFSRRAVS